MDIEKPDILVLHDYYLESDFIRNEEKEKEWQRIIRKLRVQYDDALRIVFLCERAKGDLLLSSLVSFGVKDIFNENSIDLETFITQISQPSQFSKVEKFIGDDNPIFADSLEKSDSKQNDEEPPETDDKKNVQKVVEKKVVQKVVNKNVIKRDYKIQITNHTEKVVGVPVKKKIIMIGSHLPRSGSTFICHLLAKALVQMGITTTYMESPFSKAYTFDRFIGELDCPNYMSKFYQFINDVEPRFDLKLNWTKQNVNFVCKNPTLEKIYSPNDIPFESFIKVLFSDSSAVTIIDVGTDWNLALFRDLLDISDHIFFIIEPDIPYIQYLEESKDAVTTFLIQQLEYEKFSLIGNRFDKTIVNNQLIKKLYETKFLTYFPTFSVADVFKAQYQGIFLNDLKDYQKNINPYIEPLLKLILPKELIKSQQKGPGLFKGLFNKKITVEKSEMKGNIENETIH